MEAVETAGRVTEEVTVADVMRPALMTVEQEAHLAAAAYLMHRDERSVLVVVSDEAERRPIGIVTDSDIAAAVAAGLNLDEARIKDLPARTPVVIGPEASVEAATRTMLAAGVRQLPVVSDGSLRGLLRMSDACRVLLDQLD